MSGEARQGAVLNPAPLQQGREGPWPLRALYNGIECCLLHPAAAPEARGYSCHLCPGAPGHLVPSKLRAQQRLQSPEGAEEAALCAGARMGPRV